MMIRRLTAAAVAAIVLTLTGVLAVSSPAAAAPPPTCANTSVCGYNDWYYGTGGGYEYIPGRPSGTCEGVGLNDSWSSLYNNSGRTIRVYKDAGCTGDYATFSNGSGSATLSISHGWLHDKASSVKFVS